jgi:hypothetical protein
MKYSNSLYNQRKLKIDNLKLTIDRLKLEIKDIEDEIDKIKNLDILLASKLKIDGVRKRKVYRVENFIVIEPLMYQRFPTRELFNWVDAINHANGLDISGYRDWRLPTIDELERLFTRSVKINSCGNRYFIMKYFLNSMPKDAKFWSSSEENENYAWVADFNVGYDYWRDKRGKYYAIYVRDIKE